MTDELTSKETENTFRESFENRPGWTVLKLDSGKHKAADFQVCGEGDCFLCEAKTIDSTYANFAYRPIDYYMKEREHTRSLIERSQAENPQRKIVMTKDQYDLVYGDQTKFQEKYKNSPRNTEKYFKIFEEELIEFLSNSSKVKHLPYLLRIDSDDLCIPYGTKRKYFFQWLEKEIEAIGEGNISDLWKDNKLPFTKSYHTFLGITMNETVGSNKPVYQINIEKLNSNGPLQIQVYSYGILNEAAIVQQIDGALIQLKASANRENDKTIPRIILLAFASGFGFEGNHLFMLISEQLKIHTNISAIAVLNQVPKTFHMQRKDEGILEWIETSSQSKRIPGFIVAHNPWIDTSVRPLDTKVFDMIGSVQFSPIPTKEDNHSSESDINLGSL